LEYLPQNTNGNLDLMRVPSTGAPETEDNSAQKTVECQMEKVLIKS
jgi:hypothetical protein